MLLFVNWYGVILFGSVALECEHSSTWEAGLWIGLGDGGGGCLCSSQQGGHRSRSRLKLNQSQGAELCFGWANFSWLCSHSMDSLCLRPVWRSRAETNVYYHLICLRPFFVSLVTRANVVFVSSLWMWQLVRKDFGLLSPLLSIWRPMRYSQEKQKLPFLNQSLRQC